MITDQLIDIGSNWKGMYIESSCHPKAIVPFLPRDDPVNNG